MAPLCRALVNFRYATGPGALAQGPEIENAPAPPKGCESAFHGWWEPRPGRMVEAARVKGGADKVVWEWSPLDCAFIFTLSKINDLRAGKLAFVQVQADIPDNV